jgi:hypothetical protein
VDPQRYAQVKQVFREAIRWAPEDRAAVIAALAEDDAVRDEVRSLLAHHREAPSDAPGAGVDAARGGARAELLRAGRAGGGGGDGGEGRAIERVVEALDPIARALADADPPGADDEARLDRAAAAAAAPEQLLPAHGPIGPRTDVYALALRCVERMLGRPAGGATVAAALARARDDAARPTPRAVGLDVPDAVEAVLARALAARPMERYQDVPRFWAALRESLAASRPAPPATPPRPPIASGPARLRRDAWPLAAVALAVLAVIVVAAALAVAALRRG